MSGQQQRNNKVIQLALAGVWGLVYSYRDDNETHGLGIISRVEIENRVFGEFQTPDGTPVGETDWPFSSTGPKFAEALLAPDGNLTVTYVGP
jgi:hypothetical protein